MISYIVVMAIFCVGLRTMTDEHKLLSFVRNFALEKMPHWLAWPTVVCCACMASFWGTIIYWWLWYHDFSGIPTEQDIGYWIIDCVSTSGINELMWSLILLIRKKI